MAWAITSLVAVFHHEPWRDEADGWLMARDLPFHDLFVRTRYVGMPALWFIVQMPLARLGAPYEWMPLVHWPLAALAVGLLVFKSPLPLPAKALLVGSWYLLFEYAVVMRAYALTLACLFLVCTLWRHRKERSVALAFAIFALANTTIHGLILAAVFGLLLLLEVRALHRPRRAIGVALLGGVLAVLQVLPPKDGQKPRPENLLDSFNPDALTHAIGAGLLPVDAAVQPETWALVGAVALLVLTALGVARTRAALIFLGASTGLLCFLFSVIHLGMRRHWGFLLIVIVVAWWLHLDERPKEEGMWRAFRWAGLAALLGVSSAWTVEGMKTIRAEVVLRFSNAEAMARYLIKHDLADNPIASSIAAEAVLPFLPRGTRFYYAQTRRWGTHQLWDARHLRKNRVSITPMARRAQAELAGRHVDGYLFLATYHLPNPERLGLQLIRSESKKTLNPMGEHLFLYQEIEREPH